MKRISARLRHLALAIALPLAAGGIALYKHDRVGVAQLLVETTLTVGTVYALKSIVREQRPNGMDFRSFPSETTALSASGSSFLWHRYGWEYGLPAMALTQFVSYSRIQAHQHRWYDTLASSGIAIGSGCGRQAPHQSAPPTTMAFVGSWANRPMMYGSGC